MFDLDSIAYFLGVTVVVSPALLLFSLGIPTLLGHPLSERIIGKAVQTSIVVGLVASLIILGMMLSLGTHHVPIRLGSWVEIDHYHFSVKFVFDRLSVPFVVLSFVLCGTIGAFANKYMHRERGFNRFFVLYSLFVLGMVVTSLAGTIETLFAGWELVGLSSALLVAFYHERPSPVRNGLRVWAVYRVSDAALLVASVVLHHLQGGGDFDQLMGGMAVTTEHAGHAAAAIQEVALTWPEGKSLLDPLTNQPLTVGLLFLLAAAGKSALVPFSGWLPRAMEGPTPSSAVFYGALSVHLGAFLLLRVGPILEQSLLLQIIVISLGLITAVFAAITGRVQTDIKSALSFASLTQVGIIVMEIGFGLRYVALVHILGHACLRTLQFIRAPTLLHDYKIMENAIGAGLPQQASFWDRLIPGRLRVWFYQVAVERGFLDTYLTDFLVAPFLWFFRLCDAMERRWISLLSGEPSTEPKPHEATPGTLDELQ
ncbi:MAG: proton-conducting transporter membrane subunit [Pirellulaceae bacterium]